MELIWISHHIYALTGSIFDLRGAKFMIHPLDTYYNGIRYNKFISYTYAFETSHLLTPFFSSSSNYYFTFFWVCFLYFFKDCNSLFY